MITFRFYFDKGKATHYLNNMAEKGYALKRFFAGFYFFKKCEKGAHRYQIDFADRPFFPSREYKEFMEDTGVEIVQTWGFWIMLRKPAQEGEFQLYSDIESSLRYYTKILILFKVVSIVELICFYLELFAGANGVRFGYPAACVIGVFAFVFAAAAMKMKRRILELEEKQNNSVSVKRRNLSPFSAAGLVLISVTIITKDSVPYFVTLPLELLGLCFAIIGMVLTIRNRKC